MPTVKTRTSDGTESWEDLADFHNTKEYGQYKIRKIQKTYSDFATAGTSKQVTLLTLNAKEEVVSIIGSVTTAFDGPATYTISTGTAGDSDALTTALSVKTTGIKDTRGANLTTNSGLFSVSATTDIIAEAVSTGGNLDTSTTGVIDFYITVAVYPS